MNPHPNPSPCAQGEGLRKSPGCCGLVLRLLPSRGSGNGICWPTWLLNCREAYLVHNGGEFMMHGIIGETKHAIPCCNQEFLALGVCDGLSCVYTTI